jgi:large subunit ribosomal protein L25
MEAVALQAKARDGQGKGPSRRLRTVGRIPAVAYGGDHDTLNLSVSSEALRDILLSERGRNAVIDLQVDGGDSHSVMIKEFTLHPISRKLLHADFIRIDPNASIEVKVPFRAIGKSKGEIAGGTLLVNVREVNLRCIASAIPVALTADVSELEIDDMLRIKDLVMPEGTEAAEDLERKLLVVVPPRVLEADTEEGEEGEEGDADADAADGDTAAPAGDDKSS